MELERGMWRGKDETGEWIIGWPVKYTTPKDACIIFPINGYERKEKRYHGIPVDPSTLGEYTGQYDWFEGDIIKNDKDYYLIVWRGEGFELKHTYKRLYEGEEIEMIGYAPLTTRGKNKVGNKLDNPDLLGGA